MLLSPFWTDIDPLLEDGGRLEHHDATGRDWHLRAGLRIAARALALFADYKRAERRQLYVLASFETVRNFVKHQFKEPGAFASRKPDLSLDSLNQISSGDRLARHARLNSAAARSVNFVRNYHL